jgi:single-strand DNA-binding protein
MSELNKVFLMGRVGNELELKTSAQGVPYLKLSLATHSFNKEGAERATHWHRVMVFGNQANVCATYVRKGAQVMVEGSLECKAYTDKDGKKVSQVSVLAQNVRFLQRALPENQIEQEALAESA